VPATAERPATPTEAQDWQLHPILENVPTAHWPKVPDFDLAGAVTLPSATLEDVVVLDGQVPHPTGPIGREQRRSHGVPLPHEAPWPREIELSVSDSAPALPVPEASLFQIAEKAHAPTKPLSLLARRETPAERLAKDPAPLPARSARVKPSAARAWHGRHSSHASHERRHVAFDMGSSLGEGSSGAIDTSAIRVASLKKR